MIRRPVSFALAIIVTGIAFMPWFAFGKDVEPRYALLLVAVVVVARYLGLSAALAATTVGALLVLFGYQGSSFNSGTTWLQFTIFIGLALFVSQLVAASDHATRMYRSAHAEAEQARQELAMHSQTFLAAAAHDLKAPLTSIKGTAQVLLRRLNSGDLPSHQLSADLERIDGLSNRMASALNSLMDASRIEVGRPLDLILRPVDLKALAERIVSDHRRRPAQPSIDLRSSPDELVANVDEFRIERVLENLLSNAIKYGNGKPVCVTLDVIERPSGKQAQVTVADRGIGIAAEDLPHIFERFRRGNNVEGLPGAGLGLTGTKEIVEQHGGLISVESAPGEGTSFTVVLPLATESLSKEVVPAQAVAISELGRSG